MIQTRPNIESSAFYFTDCFGGGGGEGVGVEWWGDL